MTTTKRRLSLLTFFAIALLLTTPMSYNLPFAGLRRQVEMKCEKK
jgi:hypothetical protein